MIEAELRHRKSLLRIMCLGDTASGPGCGKSFQLRKLTYLPGDRFICPSCGKHNNLTFRTKVMALKLFFGRIEAS